MYSFLDKKGFIMKKKLELKNVKGSYDYSPEEQSIRYFIQDTLRSIFTRYGYKPLETPILSYYDMLAGKYESDNDLLCEIYRLTDQGKRKLGLRYDLTVPFAKYIALTKDLRLPFKRFEIGKVFRDGPVKTGRDREFLQCDVDVVGLSGVDIEGELISLWFNGFKALGIDVYVKYNSRNLMRGIIEVVTSFRDEQIDRVVTVLDKLDKLSKDEIKSELIKVGVTECDKLLEYFDMDIEDLEKEFNNSNNEMLLKGIEEILELKSILEALGYQKDAVFCPSLARGQDYYTGNVFEVYAKNDELTCSLGGGGRYDKMITEFIQDGNTYPAVGVSFGLSTIYEILKRRVTQKYNSTFILIAPLNTMIDSLILANTIRDIGINVEVDMRNSKLKKSFEYADKEKIPFVIVYGEDEVKNGKFKMKNMITKEEVEISLSNLDKLALMVKVNK